MDWNGFDASDPEAMGVGDAYTVHGENDGYGDRGSPNADDYPYGVTHAIPPSALGGANCYLRYVIWTGTASSPDALAIGPVVPLDQQTPQGYPGESPDVTPWFDVDEAESFTQAAIEVFAAKHLGDAIWLWMDYVYASVGDEATFNYNGMGFSQGLSIPHLTLIEPTTYWVKPGGVPNDDWSVNICSQVAGAETTNSALVDAALNGSLPNVPFQRGFAFGPNSGSGSRGEPINTSTGNFYTQHSDLSFPGKGPAMSFERTYNSQDTTPAGRIGPGWTHSFETSVDFISGDRAIVTYPDGRQVRFPYNASGVYRSPAGVQERFIENDDDTLELLFKDQTSYHYSSAGVLEQISDRYGNSIDCSYTAGFLTTVTASGGRYFALTYESGRLSQIEDSAGRSVSFDYDAAGDLTGVTDANGNITTYTYGDEHQLTSHAGPEHPFTPFFTNTYTASKVTSQTDALDASMTLTYNPYPLYAPSTTITDNRGSTSQHYYDQAFRLVKDVDPLGGVAEKPYGENGLVAFDLDRNRQPTTYDYDTNGNRTLTTFADDATRGAGYDEQNNLVWSRDESGKTTSYSYDASGTCLESISDPVRTSTFEYYDDGLVKSSHSADATTTYGYNDTGRLTSATNPLGREWTLGYDSAGRLTRLTDPLDRTTTFTPDAGSRLRQIQDSGSNVFSFDFDDDDRMTAFTDAEGNRTDFGYDVMGNLTSVTDATSRTTSYTHDPNYNLTGVTNARGNTTSYGYDAANRLTSVTDAVGNKWSYLLDAVGNLMLSEHPDGRTVTLSYTPRDRLASATLSDGPRYEFDYTPTGWISAATDDASHAWSLGYNALGWITSSSDSNDGDTFSVNYSHDEAGRVTGIKVSGEETRTYGYDLAGNLTTLTVPSDPGAEHTTYTYNDACQRISMSLPDGSAARWDYDQVGRVASVSTTTGASDVLSFDYTRDGNGNLTSENGDRYRYDSLSRLSAWYDHSTDTTTTYGYDANYNLTTVTVGPSIAATFTYDAADRIASPG
ncbi:MAG: RHS repeat protein, partial [Actinobacteria bacterium]